jgi:hypothetical protein
MPIPLREESIKGFENWEFETTFSVASPPKVVRRLRRFLVSEIFVKNSRTSLDRLMVVG